MDNSETNLPPQRFSLNFKFDSLFYQTSGETEKLSKAHEKLSQKAPIPQFIHNPSQPPSAEQDVAPRNLKASLKVFSLIREFYNCYK